MVPIFKKMQENLKIVDLRVVTVYGVSDIQQNFTIKKIKKDLRQ